MCEGRAVMAGITIRAIPRNMGVQILNVPAFPGNAFGGSFPEAIGDSARSFWFGNIKPEWATDGDKVIGKGAQPNELDYTVTFTTTDETVDVVTEVTNRSDQSWKQSQAFNCFSPIGALDVRDHDCLRHWVGVKGKPTPLLRVPRKFGPRPTIQLYAIDGGPKWQDIPFVANFRCSPDDVHLDPWMAIESKDRKRVIATAAKPCLYLFQNMEYSCIHAASGFGTLNPGQSGRSLTRLWFVRQGIREWYARMKKEMAEANV
jgi:hypothetical protein